MPRFREIPTPPNPRRARLELGRDDASALDALGARHGLALAAVCRITMSLVARGLPVDEAAIAAEATRIRAEYFASQPPAPPPAPKRLRGRPRKHPLPAQSVAG